MTIFNYFHGRITNGKWILLANVCQSALSFAILMSMVRLGTKEDVGTFAFAQSVLVPVQLFFTLKLRTVECSDAQDIYSFSSYHNTRRLTAVGNLIVGLMLLVLFVDNKYFWPGLFLLFSYSLLIVRETYGSNLIKIQNGLGFFLVSFAHAVVSILAVIVVFYFTKDLASSLLALFVGRVFSYFVLEKYIFSVKATKKIPRLDSISLSSTYEIIRLALPLGLTALVGALFTSLPRLLVENGLGVQALAVYATVTSLLFVFNLFVNSYIQSALPLAAKAYLTNKREFSKSIGESIVKVIAVSLILALVSYIFGEFFLRVVFGNEYQVYKQELVAVVISGAALSLFSMGNLLLSSQRSFAIQLPIYLVVAFFIFMAVHLGIRYFGLLGAIVGQGVAYFVGFGVCYIAFIFKVRVDARNYNA